jgi:hypothetical protein
MPALKTVTSLVYRGDHLALFLDGIAKPLGLKPLA